MTKQTNLKKILLLTAIVALLTVLFCVSASAAIREGTCGDDLTWTLDTETGELIISGTGAMSDGEAPWSYYASSVKTVSISDKVTRIGSFAFKSCTNLTSVAIPDGVTEIGRCAFYDCSGLVWVTIPDSVTSIEDSAFLNCISLVSANIPNGITEINSETFHGCASLSSVTIPLGVTRIGNNAFSGCDSFTSLVIPDSVTIIESKAFTACERLESVTIGKGVTKIVSSPFAGCYSLVSILVDENNTVYHSAGNCLIETASKTLIAGCKNSVIPDDGSVKKLGYSAFDNQHGLTSVTIPDSVTIIDNFVFNNCKGLTLVTLGKGVTYISSSMFRGCSGLTSVTIPEGVTTFGEYAFASCTSLTSITMPDNVMSVGRYAFTSCSSLTSVVFSNKLTEIGTGAFRECVGLTSVIIPANVKTIGSVAFSDCSNLTSVTVLSENVTMKDSTVFPAEATIYGFAGSTAETYAFKSSRTFVPLATDITSVFELEATYTPDASMAGQYVALATFNRVGADASAAVDLLYVEGATGALCVKSTEGVYLPLRGEDGSAIVIGENAVKIAVVYDDNTGVARFYVDGVIPYVGDEMVLAILLPVHDAAFHTIAAVTDTFDTLDGVSVTNVYNVNASATAEFIGFQVNNEDSASIRLLAGVDMLYYGSLGFDVELYSADNLQGTVQIDSNKVFTGVMVNGSTVSAASEGYRYMTALTINGIRRADYPSDVEVYFLVKTYTMVGGVKTYGETKKILITYDTESGEYVYSLDKSYVAE